MATCKNPEKKLEEYERYLEYLKDQLTDKKHDIAEHRKNVAEIQKLARNSKNIPTTGYQYDIKRLQTEIALDVKIQARYERTIKATEQKIKLLKKQCKE